VVYDSERAEPVCSKCGLVLDEMRFDFLVEFNTVPKRRASHPKTFRSPKRSLEHPPLERSLLDAFFENGIQKVVQDKALDLCHVVRKQRFHAGYPVSTLSRALIYTAHRLCHVPVTLAECVTAAAEKKKVARCYDKLYKKLDLNIPRFESRDYLSHLAKKRKVDDNTAALASKILERVKENRLVRGANPIGIAAGALYVACTIHGDGITQKELAGAAMVSDVTIRANCKMIKGLLQALAFCERRV